MSAEPISVRIARLRGCEPVKLEDHVIGPDAWSCACETGGRTHGPSGARTVLSRGGNEAWLQPAAWAALLTEMVDDCEEVVIERRSIGYMVEIRADEALAETLGEAIALAYEAWATAKEARQ